MWWSLLISSLDVGTTFFNSGKNKIHLFFLTRRYDGAARGGVGYASVYDLLASHVNQSHSQQEERHCIVRSKKTLKVHLGTELNAISAAITKRGCRYGSAFTRR